MLIIIFFLLILIIYKLHRKTIKENFNDEKEISIDEFNTIFNSDIVTLPKNIIAFGYNNNIRYKTNNLEEKSINLYNTINKFWESFIHPNLHMTKYYILFCLYDGYRERIPYCSEELKYYRAFNDEFKDQNEIKVNDNCLSPILHKNKYIYAFCKHINDVYTIPFIDLFYIQRNGHIDKFSIIDNNNIQFDNKINKCVYRGNIINGTPQNFFNKQNHSLNQREYFKSLLLAGKINNIDYRDDYMSIEDQIKYKYILDIDGWTNTWDGTIWKLYSGSVLLKTESIWKQWYYDDLKPYIHYVPVNNDFSNLNEQIEWCQNNQDKCKEITNNAKKFVLENLNFEKVKNDIINVVIKNFKEQQFT